MKVTLASALFFATASTVAAKLTHYNGKSNITTEDVTQDKASLATMQEDAVSNRQTSGKCCCKFTFLEKKTMYTPNPDFVGAFQSWNYWSDTQKSSKLFDLSAEKAKETRVWALEEKTDGGRPWIKVAYKKGDTFGYAWTKTDKDRFGGKQEENVEQSQCSADNGEGCDGLGITLPNDLDGDACPQLDGLVFSDQNTEEDKETILGEVLDVKSEQREEQREENTDWKKKVEHKLDRITELVNQVREEEHCLYTCPRVQLKLIRSFKLMGKYLQELAKEKTKIHVVSPLQAWIALYEDDSEDSKAFAEKVKEVLTSMAYEYMKVVDTSPTSIQPSMTAWLAVSGGTGSDFHKTLCSAKKLQEQMDKEVDHYDWKSPEWWKKKFEGCPEEISYKDAGFVDVLSAQLAVPETAAKAEDVKKAQNLVAAKRGISLLQSVAFEAFEKQDEGAKGTHDVIAKSALHQCYDAGCVVVVFIIAVIVGFICWLGGGSFLAVFGGIMAAAAM